jgi:hypothetical protein
MHSIASWGLGMLLGMRHALEPDHLTAVSTLVTRERAAGRGAWLGAFWGIGHSASLLIIGTALAAFHARMPEHLALVFELAVSAMLVGLGVRSIVSAARDSGCDARTDACGRDHVHVGRWAFATRSLMIGIVHGLAGSGALVALVAAELPTVTLRLAYIAVFGAGSVGGMVLLSGLAGIPLARLGRSPRLRRAMVAATGAISIAFGIAWALRLT